MRVDSVIYLTKLYVILYSNLNSVFFMTWKINVLLLTES